ncbi:DUF5677 domain-containing protein [Cohnella laeviribosi]|uniref:DUF5677 domain-containing protein n=1 Tax=Cohnella laeviribosi TaxID=380174 RepID=UPI0009FD0675|nr:DUF5677 domain-containing protein [Cohnella laeviribosi]
MLWKFHEVISEEQLKSTKELLNKWLIFIDKIRDSILQNSTTLENKKDQTNQRHMILSELSMAQFFTFNSIATLVSNAHYSDAFTLLRVLYEGHLHFWNLWNCDDQEIKRYIGLIAMHEWSIANEVLSLNSSYLRDEYYNAEKLEILKKHYDEARLLFNCREGKIPKNYTTKSTFKLAQEIDESEGGSPFRQLMHSRLYSSGSEYVHRSFYGLREGYAIVENNGKHVLFPNPRRGIETCWWATSIELDTVIWHSSFLELESITKLMKELRDEVRELAKEWLLNGN